MSPLSPTALDLFYGGSFSLGLIHIGFQVLVAVDFTKSIVEPLRANLKHDEVRHLLESDLIACEPSGLADYWHQIC